jgi:hypothetical protein
LTSRFEVKVSSVPRQKKKKRTREEFVTMLRAEGDDPLN